jgi:tetratricopeptide (TPR) repeat protein
MGDSIGSFHPQVVHFAIALLITGVVFRLLSLTGRLAFAGPAASVLLLLGTAAAVAAVQTGTAAHGPVERVPGSRDAVVEHEDWGIRARNVFLAVASLEIVGLAGLFCLYEASEHGGELVYSYAGGVGIRSGEPEDVARLLLAGLYHQAQLDRKEGRAEEASRLVGEMARRFPKDLEVQMLAAESLLLDAKDAEGALSAIDRLSVPDENRRLVVRHGVLRADALQGAGRADEARSVLEELLARYPDNRTVKEKLSSLPPAP